MFDTAVEDGSTTRMWMTFMSVHNDLYVGITNAASYQGLGRVLFPLEINRRRTKSE